MRPLKKLNDNVPDDETIQKTSNQRTVRHGRKNIRMVENILLIWLDSSIDMNNVDCQNTISKLQHAINSIETFIDSEECVQFLTTIEREKICMIISGALGEDIVPHIHNMPQVDTIFIHDSDKEMHQQWTKDWSKIKGVFTEVHQICEALRGAVQQCEQNAIPISFMATSDDISKKKLDQLEPSFMYSEILKEVLLTITFEEQHRIEFLEYCEDVYEGNAKELNNVKQLKRQYRNKTPIWWYTCQSFLYSMVNHALRTLDGDIIIKLGFFISDLHRQIERLYRKQFINGSSNQILNFYRGQGMSKDDFNKMKKTEGGLLSFNCFLSTSNNCQISLQFANDALGNPDLVGILFVMTVDPHQSTTPFASVADFGYFGNAEEEMLFSMHTVFRIVKLTPMTANERIYEVNLTLTSANDKDLSILSKRIREEAKGLTGWHFLGELLLQIGQPRKAQQIYEGLLNQTDTEIEKARFYNRLGFAKSTLGELNVALELYEKSLEIRKRSLPFNHPDLAKCYMNIGLVYSDMGEYSQALSSHEKALQIQQQSLPSNHPDLAKCYGNLGLVHSNMAEYAKALASYKKTLEIQQQSLPSNHPDLAKCYMNIGLVYSDMGEYSQALSSHEKALQIQQQSLPSNHPDLAKCYGNIGLVYSKMGEYSKALSSYDKALQIQQQSLSYNHPDLAKCYMNIGLVYTDMAEYAKALASYEKTLEIQQQSLPSNHPDLAKCYMNVGLVYFNMAEYLQALSSYDKALEIQQQSLPSNHPDLTLCYMNIGLVYYSMGEYLLALASYEKSLEIQQQSLSSNHPDLAKCYGNIGLVYSKIGEYSKAVSNYEKALELQKQSLPSNHPELALSYNNIGWTYYTMTNYSKALSYIESAINIGQQSLPMFHPELQRYKTNLDLIKKKL